LINKKHKKKIYNKKVTFLGIWSHQKIQINDYILTYIEYGSRKVYISKILNYKNGMYLIEKQKDLELWYIHPYNVVKILNSYTYPELFI
jgi:hypothetical protein